MTENVQMLEDQTHSPKKQVPNQFHTCLHSHRDDAEQMDEVESRGLMLLEIQSTTLHREGRIYQSGKIPPYWWFETALCHSRAKQMLLLGGAIVPVPDIVVDFGKQRCHPDTINTHPRLVESELTPLGINTNWETEQRLP